MNNYEKEKTNTQKPLFDYIKCPLNRYTFKIKNIR